MNGWHLLTALSLCLSLLLVASPAPAAEIRPVGIGPDGPDLSNGEFRMTVRDADSVGETGGFTAELFLPEQFEVKQIQSLTRGDRITVGGQTFTVGRIDVRKKIFEGMNTYEIYPQEEFDGYIVFQGKQGGLYTALINDWTPVVPVGEIRVKLPLPEGFVYLDASGGETAARTAEDFLAEIQKEGRAEQFTAYNTFCTIRDGVPVQVLHSDYPEGPDSLISPDPTEPASADQ